ncbi:MAG: tryptophan synthase subunit alpha [Elusimicrobia bacterium RIFOXYB2_FULL_48_7]|nr:MAG: tryptophan synthase subunit alpha [Elusimicrobia bacterium RIFOXYB2_FULL_48_7]
MNRLEKKLKKLKATGRKALISYITAGYPNIGSTKKIVSCLESSGTDIIELGLPFSDPIADGPVIQHSSHKALERGMTPQIILQIISRIRKTSQIPLIIMTYLNPVYRYGVERFFADASKAGLDGMIIPDITPEEGRVIINLSKKYNISVIFLITPTTVKSRQGFILEKSRGFVYVVSITGVTGPRKEFHPSIIQFLKEIRRKTKKPLMLGFGISHPQQLKKVKNLVDGVIIGSAIVKITGKPTQSAINEALKRFLKPFRAELDRRTNGN